MLTRLKLNVSHPKFRHNLVTVNSMYSCGPEPETTTHLSLRCQNHKK